MTANIQQGSLLDVLKKKMRQTKEEMEKYKEECDEYHKRLQLEIMRREEVRIYPESLFFYRGKGKSDITSKVDIWSAM
jgi:hypothetical protein